MQGSAQHSDAPMGHSRSASRMRPGWAALLAAPCSFVSLIGAVAQLASWFQFRYVAVSFSITLLAKYFALALGMSGIPLFALSSFFLTVE